VDGGEPGGGYPQEQKVLAEYRAYYQAHNCVQTCPYPGIPELLERLRRLDPELPYRANTLTRKLNALTRRLKEEKGIEYWKSRRPESRQLTFLRTEDEEEDEEHDGDDDDDDSAPAEEIPSLPSLGSESGGDGDG
jgi:hypothetical protein